MFAYNFLNAHWVKFDIHYVIKSYEVCRTIHMYSIYISYVSFTPLPATVCSVNDLYIILLQLSWLLGELGAPFVVGKRIIFKFRGCNSQQLRSIGLHTAVYMHHPKVLLHHWPLIFLQIRFGLRLIRRRTRFIFYTRSIKNRSHN